MSKKHKKFSDVWTGQGKLGSKYGISAIAVGKILEEYELKDSINKHPTQRAIDEGYAKSTPLKDGTPYFMWNYNKVHPLIQAKHQPLSRIQIWVNKGRKTIKEANKMIEAGDDKLGFLMLDCFMDEVPKDIRQQVQQLVEAEL
jgi:hypothetical protein